MIIYITYLYTKLDLTVMYCKKWNCRYAAVLFHFRSISFIFSCLNECVCLCILYTMDTHTNTHPLLVYLLEKLSARLPSWNYCLRVQRKLPISGLYAQKYLILDILTVFFHFLLCVQPIFTNQRFSTYKIKVNLIYV